MKCYYISNKLFCKLFRDYLKVLEGKTDNIYQKKLSNPVYIVIITDELNKII